jgi:hypothetical protein
VSKPPAQPQSWIPRVRSELPPWRCGCKPIRRDSSVNRPSDHPGIDWPSSTRLRFVPGSSPARERYCDCCLSVHRFASGSRLATLGSTTIPFRAHSPIHGFPNPLFDQLYLPGRSSSSPVAATSSRRNPGGPSAAPGGFPMPVPRRSRCLQFVERLLNFVGMILEMFGLVVKTIVEIRF